MFMQSLLNKHNVVREKVIHIYYTDEVRGKTMFLKVNKVTQNEDGTREIDFEADEEFVAWFKQKHNLKRWSQKRFEKFVVGVLQKYEEQQRKT